MTWTYTSPMTDEKDVVRYLVGDTDANDQLTSDEEIIYQLSVHPTPEQAAIAVADQLATLFARYVTVRTQDTMIDWNARAVQYRTIAADLRKRLARAGAIPYAGGISISDKEAVEADGDRVKPGFTRDLHDFHGTGLTQDDQEDIL